MASATDSSPAPPAAAAASPTVSGTPPASSNVKIEDLFVQYAKFGNPKSDGRTINLKNSDKWMKQANLFDKKFTTTDTAISFAKFKTKQMELKMFLQYVDEICDGKKIDKSEFRAKLLASGPPGTPGSTKVDSIAVTGRLTDTTKYTGAHKERFDDSGKGKGIEGRHDIPSRDGYVHGYKNKDAFDKKNIE